jgi:uncharacterized protein
VTEGEGGHTLVPGRARGVAIVLDEPLSFWGGLNPDTGRIIDAHHPQVGAEIAGHVLVMPAGRGSSSSPSVLAEAIRAGHGPAAIVLRDPDPIVALGAIVAVELYGIAVPVVVGDPAGYRAIVTGAMVSVDAGDASANVRLG